MVKEPVIVARAQVASALVPLPAKVAVGVVMLVGACCVKRFAGGYLDRVINDSYDWLKEKLGGRNK